jgi:cellulose synthase/poly-beta-1,6-N-acetylglucosamine synthase-like glycosyltransferase
MPKVSVVLTTYNRDSVVASTIEAILGQTYREFEFIISDDCSSDNTEQICHEYERRDRRVRYRRNERNLGMPGNLNAAIQAATGEYIANLHDGDIYHPTLLERWVAALDTCPKAGFVFNAYRALDADGKEKAIYREPLPPCAPGSLLLESIFFKRWRFDSPVWGTVMVCRAAYEKVGLFQESFGFCSDVDMWMRIADCFHVAYIDEPLISVPSREVLPRQIALDARELNKKVERMFWEARMRHYRSQPLRRWRAMTTHVSQVLCARTWLLVLSFRGQLRQKRGIRKALGCL